MSKIIINDYDEIHFALKWIICIFQEHVSYSSSLIKKIRSDEISITDANRKSLYQSGAYNYAMILLSELYELSKVIRDDDIRLSKLLDEMTNQYKESNFNDLKNELTNFVNLNAELISRLKDRRDKEDVHLTRFTSTIKTSYKEKSVEIHKSTILLEDELILLINFLIKIINSISILLNEYDLGKFEILSDFEFIY